MPTYSHSRLSTFEQCPQKYKFQYIDKIEVEMQNTVEAFMGSLVHEALERLYRQASIGNILTCQKLLEDYNQGWRDQWNETILVVSQEYTPDDYRLRGELFLRNYYESNYPFDASQTLGLETEYVLDLGEGYKYHVRIDRLSRNKNGIYEVHDYKTSSRLKAQVDLDSDRQLAMYSLWVRQNFADVKDVKLVWHFLAFNKKMLSERTPEQLEVLRSETIEKIKKLEAAKEFAPRVSSLCGWCVYQSLCPAFSSEKSSQRNVSSDARGAQLVDAYVQLAEAKRLLEVDIERLRTELIEFAQKEGIDNVYGSDKKVSVKSFDLLKPVDMKEVMLLLLKAGLWNEYAKLDTQKLSAALAEGALPVDVVEMLRNLVEKEKHFRVNVSKKGLLN